MLFVNNTQTDPYLNLALEEYLLRQAETEQALLLFYINEPAVIIGRNQNTLEEIDPDFIKEKGIHVVRRLSGGGAVFHDLGNLNFSFITPGREDLHNFAKFIEPVVAVLRQLGVAAELRGKSDIFAEGKKISGNAQYVAQQRMFSHGTILFDTDIPTMLKALNPRQVAIESRAVQSVRNFVTNIRELLAEEMDIHAFRQRLLAGIFTGGSVVEYELNAADWTEVEKLAAERYRTWAWNYGRSPHFNIRHQKDLPGGKVDVRLQVENGYIQSCKIYGSFSGRQPIAELEARLTGLRYDRNGLVDVLTQIELSQYLGDVETAAFIALF
ncbi:MAG: lipoate--protein ligase [Chloroflexota bacterium]|jgi:lipoate---protein ligase